MTKFVTVDKTNVVVEPYDSKYKNVPIEALPISDSEFTLLQSKPFDHFRMVNNKLVLRPESAEIERSSVTNELEGTPFMKGFVSMLIGEINILRVELNLPPRNMEKFKSEMKKLL